MSAHSRQAGCTDEHGEREVIARYQGGILFSEGGTVLSVESRGVSGITVIKGEPRSGKSWLVGTVLGQLLNTDWPKPLAGFCRCSKQDSDNFARVIDDLADSWRSHATWFERATKRIKWDKGQWSQPIINALSSFISVTQPIGPASSLVASTFTTFSVNIAPGLSSAAYAPRLKYEHGQELVKALAEISGATQVILVLDQWEQSANLSFELEHLQNFIRDSGDWPPTHFFVTIRSGSEAERSLDELSKGQSGVMETYMLPPFKLEGDEEEWQRLVTHLNEHVPVCRNVKDQEEYLRLIQGYPGVLNNWTRPYNQGTMKGLDDLARVASDAQSGRYPEFGQLDSQARKLCIRLGLLPNLTDENWRSLQPILTDGTDASCLDDLFSKKLLEKLSPPSFGHQQRSDSLQRWLCNQRKTETSEKYRILVRKLAGQILEVSTATQPFIEALAALDSQTNDLMTDGLTEGLCEAAVSCFGVPTRGAALLRGSEYWRASQQVDVVGLVAIGLVNTGIGAKAENDLTRRDALLEEFAPLGTGPSN